MPIPSSATTPVSEAIPAPTSYSHSAASSPRPTSALPTSPIPRAAPSLPRPPPTLSLFIPLSLFHTLKKAYSFVFILSSLTFTHLKQFHNFL
jgi:hypothetical protein